MHVLISGACVIMTTSGDDSAETISPINAKEKKLQFTKIIRYDNKIIQSTVNNILVMNDVTK